MFKSGETRTTTIDLINEGDKAVIESGGRLEPAAGVGIEMNNNNQTTLNQGSISTTNVSAHGIDCLSVNNLVNTSGQISTTGDGAYGIRSEGDFVSLLAQPYRVARVVQLVFACLKKV